MGVREAVIRSATQILLRVYHFAACPPHHTLPQAAISWMCCRGAGGSTDVKSAKCALESCVNTFAPTVPITGNPSTTKCEGVSQATYIVDENAVVLYLDVHDGAQGGAQGFTGCKPGRSCSGHPLRSIQTVPAIPNINNIDVCGGVGDGKSCGASYKSNACLYMVDLNTCKKKEEPPPVACTQADVLYCGFQHEAGSCQDYSCQKDALTGAISCVANTLQVRPNSHVCRNAVSDCDEPAK